MQHKEFNDIKVLKENTRGKDHSIGDLHGNRNAFEHVIGNLKKHDRLFIAGDLVDRGKDSPGLIAAIIKDQRKHPGRIQVVRGNHEDITLNSISAHETILRQNFVNSKEVEKALSVCKNHHKNGGKWLTELFNRELMIEGKISITKDGKVIYSEDSQVKMIRDFMAGLPTIIHVEGKKPMSIVHADLPISQEELKRKILNKDYKLNEDQKEHAVWAREDEFKVILRDGAPQGERIDRDENSDIVYVGHNMIDDGDYSVVRPGNTVNLDVGTYANNVSLLVNHTDGTCQFVGKNAAKITDKKHKHLFKAKNELESHLKNQKERANRREAVRFAKIIENLPKLPDVPPKKASETAKETNQPPPFVFVFGGTGETLTQDQKNIGNLYKEKYALKKTIDAMKLQITTLDKKLDKKLSEKLAEETVDTPVEEKKEATHAARNAFDNMELNIDDAFLMEAGLSDFGKADKDPEIVRMNKELRDKNIEYLKLHNQYNELDKKYNILRESLENKSYGIFFPPGESLHNCNLALVEGVASSSKYKDYKKGKKYGEATLQYAKDTYDFITAKSEKKHIKECLLQLEKTKPLPERIVLSGHSRGASSCIELARAIYLQYGEAIKIDINISDPVPGPARHGKSKKVIPPNVESLVIAYSAKELKTEFKLGNITSFFTTSIRNKFFKPQNLHKIFYDERKTTVTSLVLPTMHLDPNKHGYLESINKSFWDAVINKKALVKEQFQLKRSEGGYSVKRPDDKKEKIFTIADSKKKRIEIKTSDTGTAKAEIGNFHKWLTGGESRQVKQHAVSNTVPQAETRQSRQQVLDELYQKGREKLREQKQQRRNTFRK